MPRGLKQWKPIFHLMLIITISYFLSKRTTKIVTLKKTVKYRTDMRHILLWTKIPGFEEEGQKIFLKKNCHHYNCYIITNRTFFDNLGHYDAIVFNVRDVSAGSSDIPYIRSLSQKYIFVANESSDNYPVCDSFYDSFFNWTWSYKQDSTISYRYLMYRNSDDEDLTWTRFKWITKMKPINSRVQGLLTSKYKAAAIFMDKCRTRSNREDYIKNLQHHLSKFNLTVDIFGDCGSRQCRRKTMANCFWRLKRHYYFYLAMEDSIAIDYITKEVLYAYQNYAVPIVLGGAAYTEFLPPFSYLNAMELDEEAMASVINNAIQNKTMYHDFFRWRNHYHVYEGLGIEPCDLCKAMNNAHWLTYHTNHKVFRTWWNPSYKERCANIFGIPYS